MIVPRRARRARAQVACLLAVLCARAPGARGGTTTCSSAGATFGNFSYPAAHDVFCQNWTVPGSFSYSQDYTYENKYAHFVCPDSGKRIFASNGVPNHNVYAQAVPCETPWWIEMPLEPIPLTSPLEPLPNGIVGITRFGMPMFSAQSETGANLVEPESEAYGSSNTGEKWWYGFTASSRDWRYRHPLAGNPTTRTPSEYSIIGYALDGYPIYGPVSDASVLDACNGRANAVTGKYQYHVRSKSQVEERFPYCNAELPAINWNYVVGCFAGSTATSVVADCTTAVLPLDCEVLDSNGIDDLMCGLSCILGNTTCQYAASLAGEMIERREDSPQYMWNTGPQYMKGYYKELQPPRHVHAPEPPKGPHEYDYIADRRFCGVEGAQHWECELPDPAHGLTCDMCLALLPWVGYKKRPHMDHRPGCSDRCMHWWKWDRDLCERICSKLVATEPVISHAPTAWRNNMEKYTCCVYGSCPCIVPGEVPY